MKIIKLESYDKVSLKAANIISGQINIKEESVLGLATGSTPIKTYEYLVNKFNKGAVDFEKVKTFNLDEYIGLGKEDSQSYRFFMDKHLFSKVNIKENNIHIPNGLAKNVDKECKRYEKEIKKAGGIDLQLLGIGRNGHIGFNEPDVKFEARTHKVKLDSDTIKANARFFDSIDKVPKEAISMGIKTIMMSKKIVLVASGKSKAKAIRDLVKGHISPKVPASILQLHRDVIVIVDQKAGSLL
ncbi:MAG: glucosamine-6-phosphate deaminase [Bacillota bacterium]